MRTRGSERKIERNTMIHAMIDFTREDPISLAKVAEMFGITPQTVRKWTKRAVSPLESKKVGGKVYTSRSAIQRFSGDVPMVADHVLSEAHQEALRQLKEVHGI